jgi:hypothetical protein
MISMSRTNSRAASAAGEGESGKLSGGTPSFHHTSRDRRSDCMPMADISFTQFVISLASSAAIHFGDIPDMSGQTAPAPDLEAARQMIEILALLEEKTRGNLTAEERQVLEQILYELRLRFVEVSGASEKRIIEP